MSPRLAEVASWLARQISSAGHAPTLKEIGERFGVGTTCAFGYVRALARHDIVRRVHGKRGIVMVESDKPGPFDRQLVNVLIELNREVEEGLAASDAERVRAASRKARETAVMWLEGKLTPEGR